MERLPAIPPTSAPALSRRPSLPSARWARPVAAALVATVPALVRAAWLHREAARRGRDAPPSAVPFTLERTELWLERRRLGRVRLHVESTRVTGSAAGSERGADLGPGSRPGWTAALGLVVRMLAAAVGSARPSDSRAARR